MFKKDVLPFTNRRVPTVHDDGVLHPNYLVGLLPPLMHVDQSRAVEGVRPLYRGDIYDEKVTPLAERWERETYVGQPSACYSELTKQQFRCDAPIPEQNPGIEESISILILLGIMDGSNDNSQE